MSNEIQVKVTFRYGHRLMPPYEGRCNFLHGEGGTAIINLVSDKLDKNGMVIDFGTFKKQVKQWLDDNWDHAYLHKFDDEIGIYLKEKGHRTFEFKENPTAEHMADYLYNVIKNNITPLVTKVGIVESFEDSIAYYEK